MQELKNADAWITPDLVQQQSRNFQRGKSCSDDRVSAAMFLEFGIETCAELARAFSGRIANGLGLREDPIWDEHMVSLIKTKHMV